MVALAGEHMHEFEEFEASKFVSRLLGKGDWKGFHRQSPGACHQTLISKPSS